MARKKAKKSASNHGRAPGKTQISISLTTELVSKIDKLSKVQNRNRSNYIATVLDRIAAEAKR